jgi:hypothetical protein
VPGSTTGTLYPLSLELSLEKAEPQVPVAWSPGVRPDTTNETIFYSWRCEMKSIVNRQAKTFHTLSIGMMVIMQQVSSYHPLVTESNGAFPQLWVQQDTLAVITLPVSF